MPGFHPDWWKVAVIAALSAVIVHWASRPRRAGATSYLVATALLLYAVGAGFWVVHHALVACALYGAGIVCASVAVWRSRGGEPEDPPDGGCDELEPLDDPGGPQLWIDWEAFARDLQAWDAGRRQGVGPR